jgi:hypothetical protein
MNPAAVVAIVFALMFLIGIAVGFIIVIAMSVIRGPRRGPRPGTRPPRAGTSLTTDDDDTDHDDHPAVFGIPGRWDAGPSWPGDSDAAR